MSTLAGKTDPGKPRNPYIAGKALGSAQGFFGRHDVFEVVESTLEGNQTNAIVLFGQRRIGKTSVLLQLARRLAPPDYLPIYLDLMDRANRPVGEVLHALASAIAVELGSHALEAAHFDDDGVYFQRKVLPQLYKGLGEHQRPVFLLDEFDVLDTAEEQRLGSNAAANSFFPYIRRLIEQEQRLGFVFVVGRKAADLSIHAKAVFKSARYKRVSILDRESAVNLVRTAESLGTLTFLNTAVDRVLALTSGHPYFTQLLCGLLWDRAWRGHTGSAPPRVDQDAVEAAVPALLEAGENVFEWIWDGLPAAERVIFAAIAQAVDERGAISDEDLTEMLQGQGIRILTRELEVAPATLVEWEMLARREGGYGFFIEVLRRWVAVRKPLPRVKEELDRVVPLADTLYQTGNAYHRQGDSDRALDQLRQALRVNPNHLKARLLVAEISTETGDLATARKELEEAYRYDEAAARFPLIRVLLLQGEVLEQNKKDDEALSLYQHVLTLSPRERVARERHDAIWRRRGDNAFEAGDFDTAYVAFERARLNEKLEEVKARKIRLQRERMVSEAQELAQREDWDGARSVYQRLREIDPTAVDLDIVLAAVEEELSLQSRYNEAIGLVQQKTWEQAIPILSEIIYRKPTYKHAAWHLADAVEALRTPKVVVGGPQTGPSPPENQPNQIIVRESRLAYVRPRILGEFNFKIAASTLFFLSCIGISVVYPISGWTLYITSALATIGVVLAILSMNSMPRRIRRGAGKVVYGKTYSRVFLLDNGNKIALLKSGSLWILDRGHFLQTEVELAGRKLFGFREIVVGASCKILLLAIDRKLYLLGIDGTASWVSPLIPGPSNERPNFLAMSGDERNFAVAMNGQIWLLGARDSAWRTLPQFKCDPQSSIKATALNKDGSIVAISLDKASATAQIKGGVRVVLLRVENGQVIGELQLACEACQIAFSPDGLFWTIASTASSGQLFTVPKDQKVLFKAAKIHSYRGTNSVAFSPDGKFLAVGTISDGLHITEVATGKQVTKPLSKGFIEGVDFSPDGTLLVANISDFGVAIFDLKNLLDKERSAHIGLQRRYLRSQKSPR